MRRPGGTLRPETFSRPPPTACFMSVNPDTLCELPAEDGDLAGFAGGSSLPEDLEAAAAGPSDTNMRRLVREKIVQLYYLAESLRLQGRDRSQPEGELARVLQFAKLHYPGGAAAGPEREEAPVPQASTSGRGARPACEKLGDAELYEHRYVDPEQNGLVFCFSHVDGRPRSDTPLLYFGDVCGSRAEARIVATEVAKQNPEVTIVYLSMHVTTLITTYARATDAAYNARRIAEITDLASKRRETVNRAFKEQEPADEPAKVTPLPEVEADGEVPLPDEDASSDPSLPGSHLRLTSEQRDTLAEWLAAREVPAPADDDAAPEGGELMADAAGEAPTPRLTRSTHRFLALRLVMDGVDDDLGRRLGLVSKSDVAELLIEPLQAFATQAEAEHYLVHCAAPRRPSELFVVAPLGRWVDPLASHSNLARVANYHPNATFNDLAQSLRDEIEAAEHFKRTCADQGLNMPVTYLDDEGRAVAVDGDGKVMAAEEYDRGEGEMVRDFRSFHLGPRVDAAGTLAIMPE